MNKETFKKIDYSWLTNFSGDPFADAGGSALKEFAQHFPNLDILEIIMKATDIYVNKWNAKINTFFLNSKITQPAFDSKRKKEETKKYFLGLLEETEPFQEGFCRITGQQTKLFPVGRDNSVMTGSNTFVNFHHSFQSGIYLSKEAIIRYHFLPLACELLQGNIAIIHSNRYAITDYFAKKCCSQNLSSVSNNLSDGILKSKSLSAGTAVFRFADEVIQESKLIEEEKGFSITLYHFTNFGASPSIQIYALPFEELKFYRFTQKMQYKKQWNSFIGNYYSNKDYKKAIYDKDKNVVVSQKDNQGEVNESVFKYWNNTIYNRLINNTSILPYLLKYSRSSEINFEVIKIYEINVRKMKKETITKIEQMADYILASNDERGVQKAIKKLDGVKSSYLLRRFILKDIVAQYYNAGNNEAIVTIEDYTEYLFPDTNSWQETRDVLLIAIYQKLHEKNIFIKTDLSDQDNLEIEENTDI